MSCSLFCTAGDKNPEKFEVSALTQDVLQMLEADSFWCMQKLLEGIQDNYTLAQLGIQTKIMALKDLIKRLDGKRNALDNEEDRLIGTCVWIGGWGSGQLLLEWLDVYF